MPAGPTILTGTLRIGTGAGVVLPSLGLVTQDVSNLQLTHSFFDVFFELDINPGSPLLPLGGTLYNTTPLHMVADFWCLLPNAFSVAHNSPCVIGAYIDLPPKK